MEAVPETPAVAAGMQQQGQGAGRWSQLGWRCVQPAARMSRYAKGCRPRRAPRTPCSAGPRGRWTSASRHRPRPAARTWAWRVVGPGLEAPRMRLGVVGLGLGRPEAWARAVGAARPPGAGPPKPAGDTPYVPAPMPAVVCPARRHRRAYPLCWPYARSLLPSPSGPAEGPRARPPPPPRSPRHTGRAGARAPPRLHGLSQASPLLRRRPQPRARLLPPPWPPQPPPPPHSYHSHQAPAPAPPPRAPPPEGTMRPLRRERMAPGGAEAAARPGGGLLSAGLPISLHGSSSPLVV